MHFAYIEACRAALAVASAHAEPHCRFIPLGCNGGRVKAPLGNHAGGNAASDRLQGHWIWKRVAVMALAGIAASSTCQAKPLIETLQDAGQFSTLLVALHAAGLDDKLRGPGPFTVLAPTDQAFAALPAAQRDLVSPGHEAELQKVLVYHLIAGRLTSGIVGPALADGGKAAATTLVGAPVVIGGSPGHLQINDAHVTQADLAADNGVIEVIDAVLVPPTPVQPQ